MKYKKLFIFICTTITNTELKPKLIKCYILVPMESSTTLIQ